jgi:general stress protein YciG
VKRGRFAGEQHQEHGRILHSPQARRKLMRNKPPSPVLLADRGLIRYSTCMEDAKKRGFDAIPPERRREISSMGGREAHARGTAHEFTSEEAREAGRRGGQVAHELGRAHRFVSGSAASEAGRRGAAVRAERAALGLPPKRPRRVRPGVEDPLGGA